MAIIFIIFSSVYYKCTENETSTFYNDVVGPNKTLCIVKYIHYENFISNILQNNFSVLLPITMLLVLYKEFYEKKFVNGFAKSIKNILLSTNYKHNS